MNNDLENILSTLLSKYLEHNQNTRTSSLDSDNIQFHKENEMSLKVPSVWRGTLLSSLVGSIRKNMGGYPVLFFYSNTSCYRDLYKTILASGNTKEQEDITEYCSYYELQCAILNAMSDIRPQERIKNMISGASVVVVLDSSKCQENVLNAIRQFTCGSLILID